MDYLALVLLLLHESNDQPWVQQRLAGKLTPRLDDGVNQTLARIRWFGLVLSSLRTALPRRSKCLRRKFGNGSAENGPTEPLEQWKRKKAGSVSMGLVVWFCPCEKTKGPPSRALCQPPLVQTQACCLCLQHLAAPRPKFNNILPLYVDIS